MLKKSEVWGAAMAIQCGVAMARLWALAGALALVACGGGQSSSVDTIATAGTPEAQMDHISAWPKDGTYYSFSSQDNLRQYGANVLEAWQFTTGDPNLVIAVLDTGVLSHAEFSGRLLPGYDFVSNVQLSDDGDGRDADATESASRLGSPDTWNGTFIAGVIAATGNNRAGIAGINWKSKILPVRVASQSWPLPQYSDMADAIVWAAGGTVAGVPNNPNPARVINISQLRIYQPCTGAMAEAVRFALARNAVVVASAGDGKDDAMRITPANCPGVITVGGISELGTLWQYYRSNPGTNVTLVAPYMASSFGIDGSFGQVTLSTRFNTGIAAAHVSGVVSLMLSVNPSLTPAAVKSLLVASARALPSSGGINAEYCTPLQCGAGMVDGYAAVKAAKAGAFTPEPIYPQTGWWWNPNEAGSGFAMEFRHGKVFFGGFLYDSKGKATWLTSGPALMQSPVSYTGPLDRFVNGQTLMGTHRNPAASDSPGAIQIEFTSTTTGRITWSGRTFPIERYEFVPGGLVPVDGQVQRRLAPGWYWDPSQPGRGYALEVQGNTLFAAAFMFDDFGDPVWYVTSGTMAPNSGTVFGHWAQYADGQSMNSAYRVPRVANASAGTALFGLGRDAASVRFSEFMPYLQLEKFDMGAQPAP